MMAALTWTGPLVGATAKKSSGSSSAILIFIVIGVGFYFLIYRTQQRKAKALREQSATYDVGDEVLTAGGIVGTIIDIDGDRVTLETSVGASFVVLKQYVIRRLEAAVPDEDEDEDEDDESVPDEDEPEGDEDGGADESGAPGPTGRGSAADSGDDSGGPDGPSST
jgi:preprotein translocase subunit YajC